MKRGALVAGAAALLALAACGEESGSFSEKEVFEAAKVEDGEVEGDPFCVVDSVLASAEAIAEERKESRTAIITSKNGNVGVVVEPPFPEDCEKTVLSGLNELDPVSEKLKE
jgi:hypothetical protein